jgi:hypothetical protein
VPRETLLDDIAEDIALWIDQTAEEVAAAFAPGRAPFAAQLTEQQKLDYYRERIFNPDGSPNSQGRNEEIARLGAEGFAHVYQAVVKAFPELKPPPPPAPEDMIGPPLMPGGSELP